MGDYDCHGEYVKYWCPELESLPVSLVHEPWKMSVEEQEKYGVKIDVDYPAPLVPPSAYVPRNKDGRNNGGGRGRKGKGKGGQRNKNKNQGGSYGRGQRQEMKSLKQGSYKMH